MIVDLRRKIIGSDIVRQLLLLKMIVCYLPEMRMKPRGTQELHSNSTTCGVQEEMHWLPIKELDKYKAFPSFMKDYLSKEHFGIEHIVTDERK